MSDLTSQDRTLIDRARAGDEPTKEDRTRVRALLAARIGVGTGLLGTTAVTARAATAAVVWPKILAAVLVTGAVGSAGIVTYRAARPALHEVAAPTAAAAGERREPPAVVGAPAATLAPLPEAIAPSSDLREAEKGSASVNSAGVVRAPTPRQPALLGNPGRPADRALSAHGAPPNGDAPPSSGPLPVTAGTFDVSGASPHASADVGRSTPATPAVVAHGEPEAPAALPPTTLEAETRLVRAGVAALHAGDAARALALFDEHARTFPQGVLAEERAAERVVALGSLRRCDEARAAAADFLAAHPVSPLAPRVRAACSGGANP